MTSTKSRNKWNKRKVAQRFFQYLILSIIVVIVFVPIVMLVFGALKTRGEMYVPSLHNPHPSSLGKHHFDFDQLQLFLLEHVAQQFDCDARNHNRRGRHLQSGCLCFCPYGVSRQRSWPFNLFTLGLMFPINVAILPVYFVLRQMRYDRLRSGGSSLCKWHFYYPATS